MNFSTIKASIRNNMIATNALRTCNDVEVTTQELIELGLVEAQPSDAELFNQAIEIGLDIKDAIKFINKVNKA